MIKNSDPRYSRIKKRVFVVCLFALSLRAATGAPAANDRWTWLGPGQQGPNLTLWLAADPRDDQTVYASTANEGIYKSTDGGQTWVQLRADLMPGRLLVNAQDTNRLYCHTAAGVYAGDGGGQAWQRLEIPVDPSAIRSFALDPNDGDRLVVGTAGGAVLQSDDGGASWAELAPVEDAARGGLRGPLSAALAISPADRRVLYAGNESGLFKSADGGASWALLTGDERLPISGFPAQPLSSLDLALDPSDPQVLYALMQAKGKQVLYKSADGGTSWVQLEVLNREGLRVRSLQSGAVLDPLNPQTLYVLGRTRSPSTGLYRSDDGGQTWVQANTDAVRAIAPSAQRSGVLYQAAESSYFAGRVFKSEDQGAAWAELYQHTATLALGVDPVDRRTLYAGVDGAIFKSTDGGASWGPGGAGFPLGGRSQKIIVHPRDPQIVYAVARNLLRTRQELHRSVDGGLSWAQIYPSDADDGLSWAPRSPSAGVLALDPADPDILYAGNPLQKSRDGGASWAPLDLRNALALAIDAGPQPKIYAGTDRGLLVSADAGQTWHAVSPDDRVGALAVSPLAPFLAYASPTLEDNRLLHPGRGIVYRSEDGGGSWTYRTRLVSRRSGSEGHAVGPDPTALVADPLEPRMLYAATDFDGVFTSADGGHSWAALNAGLPPPHIFNGQPVYARVHTLALSAGPPYVLYAGTERGLYAIDLPITGARPIAQQGRADTAWVPFTAVAEGHNGPLPAAADLGQNFPNPFNGETVIPFALPHPQTVDLAVYNPTGQQVARLAAGRRPAGTYALRWDGRDGDGRLLASGLYLYRLRTGDRTLTRKLILLR